MQGLQGWEDQWGPSLGLGARGCCEYFYCELLGRGRSYQKECKAVTILGRFILRTPPPCNARSFSFSFSYMYTTSNIHTHPTHCLQDKKGSPGRPSSRPAVPRPCPRSHPPEPQFLHLLTGTGANRALGITETNANAHKALGDLQKPVPTRTTTSNRPTVCQLSRKASLHGKMLEEKNKPQ